MGVPVWSDNNNNQGIAMSRTIYNRHKKFNEVYAYTYYIKNKTTGIKYHGVRWNNVKNETPPTEDFGKKYFTSGSLCEDFKNNPQNYEVRIAWTFDSEKEALEWEEKVNRKIYKRPDWANMGAGKAILLTEESKKKIGQKNKKNRLSWSESKKTEHAKKISDFHKGRPKSKEHIEKLKKPKPKIICIGCGKKFGGQANLKQHQTTCLDPKNKKLASIRFSVRELYNKGKLLYEELDLAHEFGSGYVIVDEIIYKDVQEAAKDLGISVHILKKYWEPIGYKEYRSILNEANSRSKLQ